MLCIVGKSTHRRGAGSRFYPSAVTAGGGRRPPAGTPKRPPSWATTSATFGFRGPPRHRPADPSRRRTWCSSKAPRLSASPASPDSAPWSTRPSTKRRVSTDFFYLKLTSKEKWLFAQRVYLGLMRFYILSAEWEPNASAIEVASSGSINFSGFVYKSTYLRVSVCMPVYVLADTSHQRSERLPFNRPCGLFSLFKPSKQTKYKQLYYFEVAIYQL